MHSTLADSHLCVAHDTHAGADGNKQQYDSLYSGMFVESAKHQGIREAVDRRQFPEKNYQA
jgi:hypothetical protein